MELLTDWFIRHCDGDWEHGEGIVLQSLDNPGWMLSISLDFLDSAPEESVLHKAWISYDDWIDIRIINGKYVGSGDLRKLHVIIDDFLKRFNVS